MCPDAAYMMRPVVVEAGKDLRLPLEPGEPIRVSRQGVGQDLQGDYEDRGQGGPCLPLNGARTVQHEPSCRAEVLCAARSAVTFVAFSAVTPSGHRPRSG